MTQSSTQMFNGRTLSKSTLHERLRTIDTIIVIAIISGQKLQRDISSLNKFVSFITCFYFQLFFPVISLVER